MAEQLLHDAQVGAVVEHVGGARVPEHVGAERPAETGPRARSGWTMAHPARGRADRRWLRNIALRATAAGPALGARGTPLTARAQSVTATDRRSPDRDDPFLAPLPNTSTTPLSRSISPSAKPHTSLIRMPVPVE